MLNGSEGSDRSVESYKSDGSDWSGGSYVSNRYVGSGNCLCRRERPVSVARGEKEIFLNVKGMGSSPGLGFSRRHVVLEPPRECDTQPAESFGKLL